MQCSFGVLQLLLEMLDLLLHTILILHILATIIMQVLHMLRMNSVNTNKLTGA